MSTKLFTRILVLLCAIFGMLFVIGQLLLVHSILDEDYRRLASGRLPPASRVEWSLFIGYPLDWVALGIVLRQGWLPILVVISTMLFWLRLIYRTTKIPIRRSLLEMISDYSFGLVLGLLAIWLSHSLRDQWFGGLPVAWSGVVCGVAFCLAPPLIDSLYRHR